jgi:hypothetical protein
VQRLENKGLRDSLNGLTPTRFRQISFVWLKLQKTRRQKAAITAFNPVLVSKFSAARVTTGFGGSFGAEAFISGVR